MSFYQQIHGWVAKQAAELAPGSRLPTDAELARSWKVSTRTIRRVMDRLKHEGVVERISGKGTFTVAESTPPPLPQPQRSSAQRLAQQLTDSIATGELRIGEALPQVKNVCVRYHISEKTVGEAYHILMQRGLVKKIGRRFFVGGVEFVDHTRLNREIVICAPDTHSFQTVFYGDTLSEAYRRLEKELRSFRCSFRFETAARMSTLIPQWTTRKSWPMACIFWRTDTERFNRFAPLLRSAVMPGSSAAGSVLLWDFATMDSDTVVPRGMFGVSRGNITTSQARTVARYCASQPRKRVVLLVDGQEVAHDFRNGYMRYHKTLYEIMRTSGSSVPVSQVVVDTEKNVDADTLLTTALGEDEGYLSYLNAKYKTEVTRADFDKSLMVVRRVHEVITQFGSDALWLVTSDRLAAALQDALQKSGIAIARDVSLLSLENDPQWLHRSLSACAPDYDRIGYLMAHAILGDIPLQRTGRGFIRIEVPLIERQTTPQ
jgi:DNA-binding transcriptional regulator YhcF (GntR family)